MTIAPESVTTLSDREDFCDVLAGGPILRSDAIVLLAGEDAKARAAVAVQLLKTGGGPFIVVTGGKHEPPRVIGAGELAKNLLGMGVAPDRILLDADAQNTREQAVNVVQIARTEGWHRLLLVASAYHAPRAYLTFVQAVKEADATETISLVNAPASQSPWWGSPPGATETRLELRRIEREKTERYQALGHVASYADGLAYLRAWESR